jgi:DNA-directed RNA polymerase subunit RPC12/RpoP
VDSQPPSVTGLQKGSFEKACTYCGARFVIEVTRRSGDNAAQSYACPECGKGNEVRAALAPEVRLVSPRSDGKDDQYQETMF